MAGSGVGTISFKVTAHVGKGEQVMVCGDSPFLGQGNPERALPLYTTPADYPLWFSKEDLPSPPGKRPGYEYRYCVFRGGRFHRWEAVEQTRVARPSKTPQVPRDSLDREPRADDESHHENEGDYNDGHGREDFSRKVLPGPPPPRSAGGAESKERQGGPDHGHVHGHGHHGDFSHNVLHRRDLPMSEEAESKERQGEGECRQRAAAETTTIQRQDHFSPSTGHRRPWDLLPTALPLASGDAAASGHAPGGGTYGGAFRAGRARPVVPAAAPFAGAGGRKLETPCFRAAKVAATAAACLDNHSEAAGLSLSPVHGDGGKESRGDVETRPAPGGGVEASPGDAEEADTDGNSSEDGKNVKDGDNGKDDNGDDEDGMDEADGGDDVRSLQFGAEAVSRMERHQREREEGLPTKVLSLRRPPSLEAEEGADAGLGLGLRLGAEAMSSPPPRALEKARASPRPWSPRAGGVVVASFYLPVILTKQALKSASEDAGGATGAGCLGTQGWTAEWDYEQLVALQTKLRVVRVGTVRCDDHIGEEDRPAVVKALLKLNCVPVFLSEALTEKCYNGYCKGVLWPVMHNMLEIYDDLPNSLPNSESINTGWQAYKEVNRAFRDKVVEVFHEGDMIWVHGFHLAILPAFLDRTVKVARIGLFLHTPFPPSEVFRALPQRQELLRGMLGADQVGFHRYAGSRHFMSCCRRLLGLQHVYNQETGLMQIAHGGKAVILTHRHAGVDPNKVRASLHERESQEEEARLRELHRDRVVIGGVESVEKVKGVWLKLLAFGDMLERNPDLVGRVSMHEVGIANPAREADYRACQQMLMRVVERLNSNHGKGTVVYEERQAADITLAQRAALMRVSSVFVTTPLHNGLSTTPMEYRIVQEQEQDVDANKGTESSRKAPGVLILSEAVSCWPAMRGGISVNPWKVESVAEAMAVAAAASAADRIAWHQEDVEWCESNTTAAWAEDVLGVLSTVPKENRCRYATTGLGLTSRVVGTDPTFRRLDTNAARRAFSASKSRVFFLDYGGTLVKDTPRYPSAGGAMSKMDPSWTRFGDESKALPLRPGRPVLEGLEDLCRDPRNVVFVVSGRGRDELEEAFGHIKGLGLAAEHGSWFRWPGAKKMKKGGGDKEGKGDGEGVDDGGWEALHPGVKDTAWKNVARRFMQDFQIHTHGSYMEEKGTAMLWHYGNAEPEFGAMQAKQLQDELTDVLCSSSASTTAVEGVAMAGVAGVGGVLPVCLGGGESNALSCSTRSSSVASEACGAIDITHEEGRNSAQGGGAYLEVRARGSSKGNFVHMVFSRMGWCSGGAGPEGGPDDQHHSASGRFCLCIGDDVSDEDMFIAVKSYEASEVTPLSSNEGYYSRAGASNNSNVNIRGDTSLNLNVSPTAGGVGAGGGGDGAAAARASMSGKENRTPPGGAVAKPRYPSFLTVTVGSKPSDASAWLPGVDAVVSLLRTLARMPTRRETGHLPKVFPHALFMETRGDLSLSPTRSLRAASTGTASSVCEHMDRVAEGTPRADALDSSAGVLLGARALNLGTGVPVARRHSFTIGGKPRISLSLGEFLRVVAQPEPEPPMF